VKTREGKGEGEEDGEREKLDVEDPLVDARGEREGENDRTDEEVVEGEIVT